MEPILYPEAPLIPPDDPGEWDTPEPDYGSDRIERENEPLEYP